MGNISNPKLYESAKAISGKSIIPLLGKTGVGKSTLVLYLAGYKMRTEKINFKSCIVPTNPSLRDKLQAEAKSGTLYPGLFSSGACHFCDMPGDQDTRPPGDIITATLD